LIGQLGLGKFSAWQTGQLSKNAAADWIALPFAGKVSKVLESVLNYRGRIHAGMIAGQRTVSPP
jgi:hypothetical protein